MRTWCEVLCRRLKLGSSDCSNHHAKHLQLLPQLLCHVSRAWFRWQAAPMQQSLPSASSMPAPCSQLLQLNGLFLSPSAPQVYSWWLTCPHVLSAPE